MNDDGRQISVFFQFVLSNIYQLDEAPPPLLAPWLSNLKVFFLSQILMQLKRNYQYHSYLDWGAKT